MRRRDSWGGGISKVPPRKAVSSRHTPPNIITPPSLPAARRNPRQALLENHRSPLPTPLGAQAKARATPDARARGKRGKDERPEDAKSQLT
eukprot:gene10290-biopygen6192